jgi:peptidoglycan/LPS O-acetylase OafA/YrhL
MDATGSAVAEMKTRERFAYQPSLDGLRALAVSAVILYHQYGKGWASGGFLGVDVFFVLSGYLITSILLAEHAREGAIDVRRFWVRRARRLLPALFIFLIIIAGYAAFVAPPYWLPRLRSDSIATLFYVENIWGAGRPFLPLPIGHMWSLSVEEQFYLAWPLLFALLLWAARRRWQVVLAEISALAAISAVVMAQSYHGANYGLVYGATQSRAHELLIGAGLAVLLMHRSGPTGRVGGVVLEAAGIAALAAFVLMVCLATLNSAWLFHGGYAAAAMCAAVTIAAAVQPSSPVLGRVLVVPPLVAIGTVSYGLYLYHVPVNYIVSSDRVGVTGVALFGMRLGVTIVVTVASFLLVERPLRTMQLSARSLAVVMASGTAVVLVVIFISTSGAASITSMEADRYRRLAADSPQDAKKVLVAGDVLASSLRIGGRPFAGAGIYGVVDTDWCSLRASGVVLGGRVFASLPCPVKPGGFAAGVRGFQPDVTVLIVGTQEVLDRVDQGRPLPVGAPETAAFLRMQLERARAILTATGAPLLLATVPCIRVPLFGARDAADVTRRIDWVNAQFREFARAHRNSVRIVDFGDFLCSGTARRSVGGQSWGAPGGVTLSPVGAEATWRWLAPIAQSVPIVTDGTAP